MPPSARARLFWRRCRADIADLWETCAELSCGRRRSFGCGRAAVWWAVGFVLLCWLLLAHSSVRESPGHARLFGRPGANQSTVGVERGWWNATTAAVLAPLLDGLRFDGGGAGGGGGATRTGGRRAEVDAQFAANQFNVVASELVDVNRELPDVRSSACVAAAEKIAVDRLPRASVVIVLHNEARSTLLRTLHSIVNRTPRRLLAEILLLDDASERAFLKAPLDAYAAHLPVPVRVLHVAERSGIVHARLVGAEAASGEVLVFLDAHVEVTAGWLEPLLARVAADRRAVVSPAIDSISLDDFAYARTGDEQFGGFGADLQFRWVPVPPRELQRRAADPIAPWRTPTIAGGLFAIERAFFHELGAYDRGMKFWGGENLELSFRTWQCGGRLEIDSCSRVGHVFRRQSPHSFGPEGAGVVVRRNKKRTAVVWMDEFAALFFAAERAALQVEAGDTSDRARLRRRLQCRPFGWFLEYVWPEAPLPLRPEFVGDVLLAANSSRCLTFAEDEGARVEECAGRGGDQNWILTADGQLRNDLHCLAVGRRWTSFWRPSLFAERCLNAPADRHRFQWSRETGQIVSVESGRCLHASGATVRLADCGETAGDPNGRWIRRPFEMPAANL